MTGLRGRAGIVGGALLILVGLAIPAVTPTAVAAATPTAGTDVSSVNGSSINWAKVAVANSFVAVKATEGDYYTDPDYQPDVEKAAAAGLYVMPYVFANPYPGNGSGKVQADYAWNNEISKVKAPVYHSRLMLPVAVDLEADPYANQEKNGNQCYGLSASAMVTWIQGFINEAKTITGKTPIIYTTADWWNACTGDSKLFSANPLWLASYGVSVPSIPSAWSNLTFWQYSQTGTVSGIGGPADLDYLGPAQASQVNTAIPTEQIRTLTSLVSGTAPAGYTGSGLPSGVSMNSSGQITGKPSAIGQYTVAVTSPAGAVPASMTFTWDVHGTLRVNSPGNRTTVAGTPVGLRVTASDQDTGYPVSFAAYGLPAGLSMNSSGLITGSPSEPGNFAVTVYAYDGLDASGSMSFTWTVKAASVSVTGPVRQVGGSGRCLDDPYSRTASGTHVDLWNCNGHANQQWTVAQDGTIRVLGKCLDVAGESKANGAKLQLWSCNPRDGAQLWRAGSDGELVNPQSGKCLDVPVSSAANGTQPVLESCANVTNQHWLRPAAAVVSGEPGKCMAASGAAVELAGCANVAAQHWTAEPDGTFRLSGECLTEAAATAGSGLSIGSCNGAAATKWKLIPDGPIATEVASTASGRCVTVPSSGTALVIESCAATPAATWQVE